MYISFHIINRGESNMKSFENGLIIKESLVHGEGLFYRSDLKEGDVISINENIILIIMTRLLRI